MTAIPISGVFGSPLSGALLTLDGLAGLEGWQIMFLAEGIPAVLLGLIVLRFLLTGPTRPDGSSPRSATGCEGHSNRRTGSNRITVSTRRARR